MKKVPPPHKRAAHRKKATAQPLSAWPLRNRLPNAPRVFVGRAAEKRQLASALVEGSVAVVTGMGGFGKTTLVVQTIHAEFAESVPRVMLVPLRAHASLDTVATEIAALLTGRVVGESPTNEGDSVSADSLWAKAIDLADSANAWIFLDDLHHVDFAAGAELLRRLNRYATRSRWIVTSRTDPGVPEIAGQVVALGALSPAELTEIARQLVGKNARAIGDGEIAEAVRVAAGSPWRLRQALAFGEVRRATGTRNTGDDLLEGLPAWCKDLLMALAVVDVALPPMVLARLGAESDPALIRMLEKRGIIERTRDGVQLHDVARGLLHATVRGDEAERHRNRVAAALEPESNLGLALERLRLLIATGGLDDAEHLLNRFGSDWLTHACSRAVWQVLEGAPASRFDSWRLHTAVAIGDPARLATLTLPPAATRADRFAWAKALLARGQFLEAAEFARTLASEPARDSADTTLRASLLAVNALLATGDLVGAGQVLDSVSPQGPDDKALHLATIARAASLEGDLAGVDRAAASLGQLLSRIEPSTAAEARAQLAAAHLACGRPNAASAVLRLTLDKPESSTAPFPPATRAESLVRAATALAQGDIATARSRLSALQRETDWPALARARRNLLDAACRLAAGDLDGVAHLLDVAWSDAMLLGTPLLIGPTTILNTVAAVLAGAACTRTAAMAPSTPLLAPDAARLDVLRAIAALRHSSCATPIPPPTTPPRPGPAERPVDAEILADELEAERALLRRDFRVASTHALRARTRARETGWGLIESFAQATLGDIAIVAAEPDTLAATAARLADIAAKAGSKRLAVDAEFLAFIAAAAVPHPATLERFATQIAVAPVAARRSRALLGGRDHLDAIDHAVVQAIIDRAGGFDVSTFGVETRAGGWSEGWGFDSGLREMWLPGGRTVELRRLPLLCEILETVAANGGEASKETLILKAWGEREYHPLRHDSRLYTAVHSLRKLIEDDPANPLRFITTKVGFAFGDTEPARWLRRR